MTAIASVAIASVGVSYFSRSRAEIEAPTPPRQPETPGVPSQPSEPIVLPDDIPAQPVPVRYTNPFDKDEVFEFPPGTSETEARDAVAAQLLERARERRGETAPLERVSSTRAPRRH